MTYLLLSIFCNAGIYLLFKWYGRLQLHIFQVIVVNYLVAATSGLLVVPDLRQAGAVAVHFPPWFAGALGLGFLFIGVFYLMAVTAHRIGVSVSTVASKMSLALGALLIIWLRHEPLHWPKLLAIVLALAGVVLTSVKAGEQRFSASQLLWPLLILLGSSVIDFGIAWFSQWPQTESEMALFSCTSFMTAGLTGLLVVAIGVERGGSSLRWPEVRAGVLLGVVNYGSIYFLVLAYDSGIFARSTLLPLNNLAVVVFNVVGAWWLFNEKLSRANRFGIFFCLVALLLLLGS